MRDADSTRDVSSIGVRPNPDRRDVAFARARVANALFSTDARVEVGRYQLLQRVGVGGMGVVWGAWDPELERRVAIKLVRVHSARARAHMLREGRALAKLSHPNVVPIYDVGTVDDEVYLVMEWVAGATLRAFAEAPRTTATLIAMLRAAGEGLVAAHRAGIVHRDFKPENVMIGSDGRVRVLDFGLARAEATSDGAAGTRGYMAPEQAAGAAATPAADQYSFCVALREIIQHPPAWVAAIVARGTAEDPVVRFASMEALLTALARDPRRVWRRRIAIASTIVLAVATFAIGTLHDTAPEACSGGAEQLRPIWSPSIAAHLAEHARALGPYGELEASVLDAWLGRYSERWIAARHGACVAHQRDEVPAPVYQRTLACLERARGALDATVGAASRAPLEHFAEAVLAVEALPDAQHCALAAASDEVAAPSPVQVPVVAAISADAAKAQYLALAADPSALALARSVALSAQTLGYRPLIGHAQLALGAALRDRPEARIAFAASAEAALSASDDVTFVEAFARELFVAARNHEPSTATLVETLPVVVAIAERSGEPGRFARALLFNNAGIERLASGDAKGAVPWFQKARAEPESEDRGVELWTIPGNLAMTVANARERDALFAEERTRLERTLGPQHAFTLQERLRAAQFISRPAAAATELRAVCSSFAQFHPQRVDKIAACNYELAWLAVDRGDLDEAKRALAITAQASVDQSPLAKIELALFAGDAAGAARDADALARAAAHAPMWWDRWSAVDAWIVAAEADDELGRRAAAIAALRSALVVLDQPNFRTGASYIQRRLDHVHAELTSRIAFKAGGVACDSAPRAIHGRCDSRTARRTRGRTPANAGI